MLSVIYKIGLSGRSFLYKKGIKKTRRLPAEVISIGNLTLGGTGKTPATIALAEEAKKQGFSPCILTRGYRGKIKKPCFINASRLTSHASRLYGDEPVLMAERLKDVPVVKCANRYKAGMFALESLNSKLLTLNSQLFFILDDGFQHWALHRDIDILLIDATDPFGNGRLFPEGILREPLKAMKRADVIVLTKTDAVTHAEMRAISLKVRQYNSKAPLYMASHKPTSLVTLDGTVKELAFNNKKVYAFSGVANPLHFKNMLNSIVLEVVEFKSFKDHYHYKQDDIDKIVESAQGLDIITTEKDLVRLKNLKLPQNLFALRIELSVDEAFYNYVFSILGGGHVKNH